MISCILISIRSSVNTSMDLTVLIINHKKALHFINTYLQWRQIFKLRYLFCQGMQDTYFQFA